MNIPSPARAALSGVPVLALLLLATACSKGEEGKAGGRKTPPVPVKTAVAAKGDLKVYLEAIGNAKPLATALVRPRVGGAIRKLHFTEGQDVKAGDLLAEIDPGPFEAALAQAEAQVAQVEGQAKQAEGQLAQAKGQLVRDQALRDNAKQNLARYREAGAGAVTAQQVDAAAAAVAQAEGTLAADQGAIAAAEGTLAANRGSLAAAKAQVENARLQLSWCRICAPFDGQAGIRLVDEGNLVVANDPAGIVTVAQMKPMSVFFFVPENDLPALQKAVAADPKPEVLAYDSARANLLGSGALAALDNQLDPATGTVKLRAVFANADLGLFPNRSVSVRLLAETRKDATLVPAQAVQIADQKRFLYVAKADGESPTGFSVERRDAKVGRSDGAQAEILDGLAPGEQVVTDGLDRLKTGTAVIPGDGKKDDKKETGQEGKRKGRKEPK